MTGMTAQHRYAPSLAAQAVAEELIDRIWKLSSRRDPDLTALAEVIQQLDLRNCSPSAADDFQDAFQLCSRSNRLAVTRVFVESYQHAFPIRILEVASQWSTLKADLVSYFEHLRLLIAIGLRPADASRLFRTTGLLEAVSAGLLTSSDDVTAFLEKTTTVGGKTTKL